MLLAFLTLLWVSACEAPPDPVERPHGWDFPERPALQVAVEGIDGQPVFGAWVTLAPDGRDASTGADGVAVFPSLEPGARFAVVAASGFLTAEVAVDLEVADEAVTVVLSPRDEPRVHGWVTDAAAQPVAGAIVQADGFTTTTASDGRYALALPPGDHALEFRATGLGGWRVPRLQVGGDPIRVDATLPGRPPDDAVHVGSSTCMFCHAGTGGAGEAWLGSAHARASRSPGDLGGTDLAAAFEGAGSVSLDDVVLGAFVQLGAPAPGRWTAEIRDRHRRSTGPMDVVAVYGGHRTGAAIAVDADGERALLPILWALPGDGLSSRQAEAGWVIHRAHAWFEGHRLLDVHTAEAAFDLQCAGCHHTGHGLSEAGDFALVPVYARGEVEPRVGCEACHGPGSAHVARPDRARRNIHNPGRMPAADALQTCARCHQRLEAIDHPFSVAPGWPVLPSGDAVPAAVDPTLHAAPAPQHWEAVTGSRVAGDQVGELATSPHRQGPTGYDGRCQDCHDPHGSAHIADLRRAPWDNGLCTGCHASRFPSLVSQWSHSGHAPSTAGPWGPSACVNCHLPRSGHAVRPDAVSGAGALRSHGLWPFHPADVAATFDLSQTSTLPPEQVPVGGCLDCHLQHEAALQDDGDDCDCPTGDPGERATFEALAPIYDGMWP